MYIEFRLPRGASGQTAYHALSVVQREIEIWLEQHPVPATQKTIKYTHRLAFNDHRHYTLFALTWNPKSQEQHSNWLQYHLIEPMKVDTN
jgi:hypothetical protein